MSGNEDKKMIKEYTEFAATCPCSSWARGDSYSGILSVHHRTCERYSDPVEIRIMSEKLMDANARVSEISKELDDVNQKIKDLCIFKDKVFEYVDECDKRGILTGRNFFIKVINDYKKN